eukprot:6204635-Pleurochrysis_carterae.AAC.1
MSSMIQHVRKHIVNGLGQAQTILDSNFPTAQPIDTQLPILPCNAANCARRRPLHALGCGVLFKSVHSAQTGTLTTLNHDAEKLLMYASLGTLSRVISQHRHRVFLATTLMLIRLLVTGHSSQVYSAAASNDKGLAPNHAQISVAHVSLNVQTPKSLRGEQEC